jgi:AcrR family transcriptional regulator
VPARLPEDELPGSARWWLQRERRNGRRRARPNGITAERIVAEAMAIIDAAGADALTLRRLADSLGTGPASLYRHVASREEIVTLVVDHFLEPMVTRDGADGTSWRERAQWFATEFRQHLLDHPNIVPLMTAAQMLGPNAMAARQRVLRGFIKAGLDAEVAVRAYLVIVHFTVAVVQLDARPSPKTTAERQALQRLFASQDPDRYPDVVSNADLLAHHDSDAEFAFGLSALLYGIDRLRKESHR